VDPAEAFSPEPVLEVRSNDGTPIAVYAVRPAGGDADGPGPGAGRARPIADAGPGSHPPVLLVHGATADHTTWRVAGPALARTRPTFALDRRGRGASGDRAAYAIEREYEDVAAAADALAGAVVAPASPAVSARSGAVDVVGHSYGGRCALGASRLTAAIRRVVAYESAPVTPDQSYRPTGLLEAVRDALERGDPDAALSTFLAGVVGLTEDGLAAYRREAVWPARVAAAHTILRELEAETSPGASLDGLADVPAPVLLILGSISRSPFRAGTDALAARLARSTVVTIDGAAHAAHHTHATEFVAAVQRFLDAP